MFGEFVDIRVGYTCIKDSKDLNVISVLGIKSGGEIMVLRTVPNAEYGSFSIKDCMDDWDKFKKAMEEMKNESK